MRFRVGAFPIRFAVFCMLLAAPLASLAYGADQEPQPTQAISVYFSPRGGCTDAIVGEVAKANHTIHVQAYSFTSLPIAQAMIDAKLRGVDVQVICDRGQFAKRAKD